MSLTFVLLLAGVSQAIYPDNLIVDVDDVTGDGQNDSVVLAKRSLRMSGCRVWSYDGTNYTQMTAPEVRTYRGYVDRDPKIQVNAWVDGNNNLDINFNDCVKHTLRLEDAAADLSGLDDNVDLLFCENQLN